MHKDTVFIEGLEARAIIGIQDWERKKKQTIRFDLELACDVSLAAAEEDIEKALDYRAISKAILAHVEARQYFLVETLAHRLAELVMTEFNVPWLRLRVSKPGAVRFSENTGVEVVRGSREA